MLVFVVTMIVILTVAGGTLALVLVGMEGRGWRQAPQLARLMRRRRPPPQRRGPPAAAAAGARPTLTLRPPSLGCAGGSGNPVGGGRRRRAAGVRARRAGGGTARHGPPSGGGSRRSPTGRPVAARLADGTGRRRSGPRGRIAGVDRGPGAGAARPGRAVDAGPRPAGGGGEPAGPAAAAAGRLELRAEPGTADAAQPGPDRRGDLGGVRGDPDHLRPRGGADHRAGRRRCAPGCGWRACPTRPRPGRSCAPS